MDNDIVMEGFRLQAELCKSLGEPKRLMIIRELRKGARSVGQLAERLDLKQCTASQHLALLRKTGVLAAHREGNTVYYSLITPKIADACDSIRDIIIEKLKRDHLLASVI